MLHKRVPSLLPKKMELTSTKDLRIQMITPEDSISPCMIIRNHLEWEIKNHQIVLANVMVSRNLTPNSR